MSSKSIKQAQRSQYKKNVQKLQRAGLIGDVDFRKKPSPATIKKIQRHRDILSGKATVVQVPDVKTAQRLRKTLGLKGSGKTLIVPKEKGERYSFQKSTGEIVSRRKGYNPGETIKKTLGDKFKVRPKDGKLYYTIPERTRGAGRLKRQTFASFDEMLYYLSKYEINFSDIEDRIEVEEIEKNSAKDKRLSKQIGGERAKAVARYKRRNKRNAPKTKKPAKVKKSVKKTSRRNAGSWRDIEASKRAPTTKRR